MTGLTDTEFMALTGWVPDERTRDAAAARIEAQPVVDNRAELRPIGTEIELVYPPSQVSGSACFTKYTYRITAHSLVAGHGRSHYAETLDAVASEEHAPDTIVFVGGNYFWVPPEKWLHLMDSSWRAVRLVYESNMPPREVPPCAS